MIEKFEPKCQKHNQNLILKSVDDRRNSKVYVCPECKTESYEIVRNKD